MSENDTRGAERLPATLRIRLKYSDEAHFIERYSMNISRGGIFIATRTPKPVGTQLRFEFQLGNGQSLIRGAGTVVWIKAFDPAHADQPHGMGVRFGGLDEESQRVIERALAWKDKVKKRGAEAPQPAPGTEPATTAAASRPAAAPPAAPRSAPTPPPRPAPLPGRAGPPSSRSLPPPIPLAARSRPPTPAPVAPPPAPATVPDLAAALAAASDDQGDEEGAIVLDQQDILSEASAEGPVARRWRPRPVPREARSAVERTEPDLTADAARAAGLADQALDELAAGLADDALLAAVDRATPGASATTEAEELEALLHRPLPALPIDRAQARVLLEKMLARR